MALVDVVKCKLNSNELVYKFSSEDLRIGTQLIVYTGQTAFFVKGGKLPISSNVEHIQSIRKTFLF